MEKKEVVFFTRLTDQYRDGDGHIHLESYEVQCKIYK